MENSVFLPQLKLQAIDWLKTLIQIPSFSKEEDKTGDIIEQILISFNLAPTRKYNNIWVKSKNWSSDLPTILLCSHHDTVKPVKGWTYDPFGAVEENGKITGLGSNDAGGSLVALMAAFLFFEQGNAKIPANLVFAAVAEEEISGKNGISAILEEIGAIELSIIGEPTQMQMAIAEKGLVVIDGEALGKAGHAARNEGINALYIALDDIQKIRTMLFPKISPLLGPVKMSVTQIEAGSQHNVVPDTCKFVIDVRTNELYQNQEILDLLKEQLHSTLTARSLRLNSSQISPEHPIVRRGLELGLTYFGSPTLSDQALIKGNTIKIGCGDSSRSHTADEFIYRHEIEAGIDIYIQLLENLDIAVQKNP